MSKILILRFSAIGDIVLASPIMRMLKQQKEGVEVHFCTKKNFKILLESNPNIDKIHFLGESLSELIQVLKEENYDYVIDLHNSLRSKIIRWRLGIKSKSIRKHYVEKWLIENLKINKLPTTHIVDRYLEAASIAGIKDDGLGLSYYIPASDEVLLTDFPAVFQKGYIAFAIGGQHATKRLPLHKLVELCKKINSPIVLLGGKEDVVVGEQVEAQVKETAIPIFNACGKYNLNQSASIVRQSKLVFSHDTAMMHVAAAFGKEVYSIWGNTIPGYGMYPYRTRYHILENKELSCRPCTKIGYSECPKGHFKCMEEISFDDIKKIN
jgi:ADP-heptose:LPS heptosyltransferase